MVTSKDITAFISEVNRHYKKKKFRIFIEEIDGEVLSIKLRSLLHIRDLSPETEQELSENIQTWSHGSMTIANFADGAVDIMVNPLHRGYKSHNAKQTITNLMTALNIPRDF